jgi:hypothetical protein
MLRQPCVIAAIVLIVWTGLRPQHNVIAYTSTRHAISVPADRAAASYQIYSDLIPLGETAGAGWPHELWPIQAV